MSRPPKKKMMIRLIMPIRSYTCNALKGRKWRRMRAPSSGGRGMRLKDCQKEIDRDGAVEDGHQRKDDVAAGDELWYERLGVSAGVGIANDHRAVLCAEWRKFRKCPIRMNSETTAKSTFASGPASVDKTSSRHRAGQSCASSPVLSWTKPEEEKSTTAEKEKHGQGQG